MGFGIWDLGCDPRAQHDRADARDDVQRHRNELRIPQPPRRHQREVGQETSDRGACGVHGVQQRDAPPLGFNVAANQMANQQRERSTHQQRNRHQQPERYPGTRRV